MPKINGVYFKRDKIWPEYTPYRGYTPNSNTYLYRTFDDQNLNDSSWNNRNWSRYSWAWSYSSSAWWYAVNNWSRWIKLPSFFNWNFTLSFYVNPTNNWLSIQSFFWSVQWSNSSWYLHFHMTNSQYSWMSIWFANDWTYNASQWITFWSWNYITLVREWSTYRIYKNWTQILTHTYSTALDTTATYLLWCCYNEDRHVSWLFDEVILENKARSASEIQTYYNNSKSLFWL